MELTATEGGGLKRMDVKEANPYLRSLAHFPPQAAFRYHKQPGETPSLALQWVRFPDGSVLAAEAESAVVTTLVTSEGKSLTEVKLIVKNQAQPFLKVALPAGATILSADVGGEPRKAGARPRRKPRPTAPSRLSSHRLVCRFVRVHALRRPVREKRRRRPQPSQHGHSDQLVELGSLSARAIQSERFRRRRDCRQSCASCFSRRFHRVSVRRKSRSSSGGQQGQPGRPASRTTRRSSCRSLRSGASQRAYHRHATGQRIFHVNRYRSIGPLGCVKPAYWTSENHGFGSGLPDRSARCGLRRKPRIGIQLRSRSCQPHPKRWRLRQRLLH